MRDETFFEQLGWWIFTIIAALAGLSVVSILFALAYSIVVMSTCGR